MGLLALRLDAWRMTRVIFREVIKQQATAADKAIKVGR